MKTAILRGLQEVFQACKWGIYGPSMGLIFVKAKRVAKFKQNAAACATVEPRLNRTTTEREPKVRLFGLQVGQLGYRHRNPLPAGLSRRKSPLFPSGITDNFSGSTWLPSRTKWSHRMILHFSRVFHGSFTRGIKEREIKESEIQRDAEIISPNVKPLLTQWYASAIRSQCVRIPFGYPINNL